MTDRTSDLVREISSQPIDRLFLNAMGMLPNPDPILRKLGRGADVYDAISYDSHVMGEVRPLHGRLMRFESRIHPASDSPQDMRAYELCKAYFDRSQPSPGVRWSDFHWTMLESVYYGFSVAEVVWNKHDSVWMPGKVLDRKRNRFGFEADSTLVLRDRLSSRVERLDYDYKFLLARHMPSAANPYGRAVFSAAFWPWTFKHSGWRYFVKFAEKFGIPWAIGKYTPGTPVHAQAELADRLAQMVEDAVGAIPNTGEVQLIEPKTSGSSPQERLIQLCNRELSKCLSSQTLASESNGEGSRAAAETHRGREDDVNSATLSIAVGIMDDLFRWITELNVPGAAPPYFEFYEEGQARKAWVEVIDQARKFIPVGRRWAYQTIQFEPPDDDDDVLPGYEGSSNFSQSCQHHEFNRLPDDAAISRLLDAQSNAELQEQMEQVITPLLNLIQDVGPQEAIGRFAQQYSTLSADKIQDMVRKVLFAAEVWGRLTAEQNPNA